MTRDEFLKRCATAYDAGLCRPEFLSLLRVWLDAMLRLQAGGVVLGEHPDLWRLIHQGLDPPLVVAHPAQAAQVVDGGADLEVLAEDVAHHVGRMHSLGRVGVVGAAGGVDVVVAGDPAEPRGIDPAADLEIPFGRARDRGVAAFHQGLGAALEFDGEPARGQPDDLAVERGAEPAQLGGPLVPGHEVPGAPVPGDAAQVAERLHRRGEPGPSVVVAHPTQKEIVETDEFSGRLGAVDSVEVRARVSGYLDKIEVAQVGRFEQGLISEIRSKHGAILEAIRTDGEIKPKTEEQLKAVLDAYAKTFA